LSGSPGLKAPLILACRPGQNSAAVQRFIDLVQTSAEHIETDA
jgi:hypothetical protein